MRENKFFKTLLKGRINPDALEVEIVPTGSSLKRTELSDAWIEGAWQEFIRQGNKPWAGDLTPKRYRMVDLVIGQDDRVILTVDPCVSYHDFIGTQTPAFAENFGDDFVSKAIATSILILTSDGKTLVTVRVKKTDYKWGGWHCSIGGFWEVQKNETPKQAVIRELEEEAGIAENEIDELLLLGAVYNPWTAHPDLVYSAKTSLTSSEILERSHDDENALMFVDTTAGSYKNLIVNTAHASVVVPLAAMLWVGEELFGQDWADEINGFLVEASSGYDDVGTRLKLEKRDLMEFAKTVEHYRSEFSAAA